MFRVLVVVKDKWGVENSFGAAYYVHLKLFIAQVAGYQKNPNGD